jgi:hypothetical protein
MLKYCYSRISCTVVCSKVVRPRIRQGDRTWLPGKPPHCERMRPTSALSRRYRSIRLLYSCSLRVYNSASAPRERCRMPSGGLTRPLRRNLVRGRSHERLAPLHVVYTCLHLPICRVQVARFPRGGPNRVDFKPRPKMVMVWALARTLTL